MNVEKLYHTIGKTKAVKIIGYINYNTCSFTSISENCNIKTGQLCRLLDEMTNAKILDKKVEPNKTMYHLTELGTLILKHLIELKQYDNSSGKYINSDIK
jgi:predicted transcriptional regulator